MKEQPKNTEPAKEQAPKQEAVQEKSPARGILGKKLGMTQVYNQQGEVIPVTVIEAGPCPVVQVKNKEADGYCAVQIGFEQIKEKRATKAARGHFKKGNTAPLRFLREIGVRPEDKFQAGGKILVDIFSPGDCVDITGTTIGKGFQGGVKRWGWAGGPSGHGSMHHRRVGSIGASSDPSRTYKNQHLPGRMGGEKLTVHNLEVISVDKENNLLAVKGAVPGKPGGLLLVRKGRKKAKVTPKIKPAVKAKKAAGAAKKPPAPPKKK